MNSADNKKPRQDFFPAQQFSFFVAKLQSKTSKQIVLHLSNPRIQI